jgi:hypothetical protein
MMQAAKPLTKRLRALQDENEVLRRHAAADLSRHNESLRTGKILKHERGYSLGNIGLVEDF